MRENNFFFPWKGSHQWVISSEYKAPIHCTHQGETKTQKLLQLFPLQSKK